MWRSNDSSDDWTMSMYLVRLDIKNKAAGIYKIACPPRVVVWSELEPDMMEWRQNHLTN